MGALALAPSPAIVERYDLLDYRRPQPLVTKQSFLFHQDASHRYGQTIAFCAWNNLSTCVPGTASAHRYEKRITPATPNFSEYAAIYPTDDRHPDQVVVMGYRAEAFSSIVASVVEYRQHIPQMGPTAVNFLLDLAGVITADLAANE
jgi:hypothetical protein